MNRLKTFCLSIMAALVALPMYSQGLVVCKKDGTRIVYPYETIDSVVTYNDSIYQESFYPIYEGTFIFATADLQGQAGHLFEGEIPGYICQSDIDPSRYMLVPFIYNEEGMVFTMDADGKIAVDAQFTGASHQTYGPVYATDIVTAGFASNFPNNKSHYDEATRIFYFDLLYHVSAGYFGAWEDTFKVTGKATSKKQFKVSKKPLDLTKKKINFNANCPLRQN